jgi:putative flippase GtrA
MADAHFRYLRIGVFNLVGMFGFGVQLVVLELLTAVGWHYAPATTIAVFAALLHNFLWHERYTWSDRVLTSGARRRFARFVLTNGAVSIVGNIAVMGWLVGVHRLDITLANICAVLVCATLNFMLADRFVFASVAVGLVILAEPLPASAQPGRDTITAWDAYVRQTEERIARELADPKRFLVRDKTLGEAIVITERERRDESGRAITVPGGKIHHWVGVVFVPGATLQAVRERIEHPERHRQLDVLETRVLERRPDALTVFLKLTRTKIVTVAYNTEHAVSIRTHGAGRLSSRSVSLRIAELENAGTPREREKRAGDDRGFLWRLNSYWRYQEVNGGVVVQCESLTLSRDVPAAVRLLTARLVDGVARESLTRTLQSFRQGLTSGRPA